MSSPINKKNLHHLTELARIELTEKQEEKLLKDLQHILDYFKKLQGLDTSDVEPMTGGTQMANVFRRDGDRESTHRSEGVEAFPERRRGYLRVPPVFE